MGSLASAAQATGELFEMPAGKMSGKNQATMPEPRGTRVIEKARHKFDIPASASGPTDRCHAPALPDLDSHLEPPAMTVDGWTCESTVCDSRHMQLAGGARP